MLVTAERKVNIKTKEAILYPTSTLIISKLNHMQHTRLLFKGILNMVQTNCLYKKLGLLDVTNWATEEETILP